MTTLYLAWQDPRSRDWFPVGRLDADQDTEPITYEFVYVNGARDAQKAADFFTIPGFPDVSERYCSGRLFPLFQNRVMNHRRPDRPEYLRQLGLDANSRNPVSELAMTPNRTHNDGFEVFPAIAPDVDGQFITRFALHGLNHTNPHSVARTASLETGESLCVAFELNNPDTTHAITVATDDHYIIGWLPRYLIDGLHQDNAWMIADVKATVAQVNLAAPLSHRLLVDFRGSLPAGFRPMEHLPQYQPIAPTADYPTNRSSGRKADTT